MSSEEIFVDAVNSIIAKKCMKENWNKKIIYKRLLQSTDQCSKKRKLQNLRKDQNGNSN